MAPLTPEHIERTKDHFMQLKQGHNEVASSYFHRIALANKSCFHCGIYHTDYELVYRAIRGKSTHPIYDATYQRFEADLRRADQLSTDLPTFTELESLFLRLDES